MHFVLFYHSLVSDWNHGNAHFLRGIVRELQIRGHTVDVYEPRHGWSVRHLIEEHGRGPLRDFEAFYPTLESTPYDLSELNLDAVLRGADVVVVHEWNEPELVRRVGAYRRRNDDCLLLFHDTHHRSATAPDQMAAYELREYDAVLAFGQTIRELYLARGWAQRAYVWHEAADTRVFRPRTELPKEGDLVWIGNWGDDERSEELREFLVEPVRTLGLSARVYGVRFPQEARDMLAGAGIEYGGWLPNFRVPAVYGQFRLTMHVPRRPYARQVPGVPTIRMFEALACCMPLVSAPWEDSDELFTPGKDFLVARDGQEMTAQLRELLANPIRACAIGERGRMTVLGHHTCRHRVDELLAICGELRGASEEPAATSQAAETRS